MNILKLKKKILISKPLNFEISIKKLRKKKIQLLKKFFDLSKNLIFLIS